MKTELEERLKQEAQTQAQEARSHRATVREIYQAVTGRTGEPGDWNGAKPVMALIEERDALRARIDDLSRAYAVQGLAIEELTAERDRYREALRSVLPSQDPLEAELICDWCGEETPFDQAQGKHADNCPWLLAHGTREPTK